MDTKKKMKSVRLNFALACLLIPLLGFASSVFAKGSSEYQVKAAFLYNLAKFVEWPYSTFADSTEPLTFGILGDDPFGDLLEQTIGNRTVKGRKVVIERIKRIDKSKNYHVLFISSSEEYRLPEIFTGLRNKSVLTVSENDGFASRGGILRFYKENNKVRFEINNDNAKSASLKISSRILKLARIVTSTSRTGD